MPVAQGAVCQALLARSHTVLSIRGAFLATRGKPIAHFYYTCRPGRDMQTD